MRFKFLKLIKDPYQQYNKIDKTLNYALCKTTFVQNWLFQKSYFSFATVSLNAMLPFRNKKAPTVAEPTLLCLPGN